MTRRKLFTIALLAVLAAWLLGDARPAFIACLALALVPEAAR